MMLQIIPNLGRALDCLIMDILEDLDDENGIYKKQVMKKIYDCLCFLQQDLFIEDSSLERIFETIALNDCYSDLELPFLAQGCIWNSYYIEREGKYFPLSKCLDPTSAFKEIGEPFSYYLQHLTKEKKTYLYLYPTPDKAYKMKARVVFHRTNNLFTYKDFDEFFDQNYEFIRARVKYDLAKNFFQDANMTNLAYATYKEQYHLLEIKKGCASRSKHIIKATRF